MALVHLRLASSLRGTDDINFCFNFFFERFAHFVRMIFNFVSRENAGIFVSCML